MLKRFLHSIILSAHICMGFCSYGQHVCSDDDCFHATVIHHPYSPRPDTVPLDTSIRFFYQIPIFNNTPLFPALTGTTGHPAVDLFKSFSPNAHGYFYHSPYNAYRLDADNLNIIRTNVPYSEWYYLIGAHREQIFKAIHAQDAGENFNFGLDLSFINSKGAYTREHAKTSHAGFYAQYRDPVQPFESSLLIFFNRVNSEENGGISDPRWYDDTTKINRELIPVWLYGATNQYNGIDISLKNSWSPGNRLRDSVASSPDKDSLVTGVPTKQVLKFSLFADLNYQRHRFLFRDTDPFNPFYPMVRYIDTTVTHDSVAYTSYTGDFGLNLVGWNTVGITAGVKYIAYQNYDTLTPNGSGSILEPYTRWKFNFTRSISLDAGASLKLSGQLGTAHTLTGTLTWKMKKKIRVQVHLRDWTDLPMIQDIRHSSNHFYWINDFKAPHFTQLNPVLTLKGRHPLHVEGRATRISNLIYYDTRAIPVQHDGGVTLWQLFLTSSLDLNRFVIDYKTGLQRATDGTILRQPHLMGEVMTGYRFSLFDGKIRAIGGVVLHGRSKAYRDEYMPATRVFYHTRRTPVEGYVWADPFLSLVLKKTRFLLAYHHASAWIDGFGRYDLPGYPMKDPSIRFVVSWRFMD
jgi:hypothetical protein